MRFLQIESSRASELAVLNKQLIEDEGSDNPMNMDKLTERMATWLDNEYGCYAIEREEVLVAYCLYRDDGEHYYIRQLFTVREQRRKGLGRALLDFVEQALPDDKPIRLEVLSHNVDALKFYEAYGFTLYSHTLSKRK